MRPKPLAYYEAKMVIGSPFVFSMLILLGYAAFIRWSQQSGSPLFTPTDMQRDLLLLLPLCVALSIAPIMTLEVEARMVELRASYAEPRWLLPLLRTVAALAITLGLMLGGGLALWISYGPYQPLGVWLPTLPPTICLIGAALLAGNLSGHYWVAAGIALGWWFLDIQTRGALSHLFFLFNGRWPLADVDPVQNYIAISSLGVILVLLNGVASVYRRPVM